MSVPMTLLTVGAALGVGAASVPVIGTALSRPITGEVVPTRITDLAGYLVISGGAKAFGEDPDAQFSTGDVAPGVGASANPLPSAGTTPIVTAPKSGVQGNTVATPATNDQKRMLAVASFGAGLVIAFASFVLIRRVVG